jgi:peptidoglycan glycosyltransferase
MGRRIRWTGLVLIACFTLIMLQLLNIQFRQASKLDASINNPRHTATRFVNQRGLILAATGQVLAKSQPVPNARPDSYRYYRTYPTGPLFSGIVGYSSYYYGTSGVENVYNDQLISHSQSAQTLGQLLSPPPKTTGNVTLTVHRTLQLAAQQALAAIPDTNRDGAVVDLDPRTGAVLAMYSSPSYDPNQLSQPNVTAEKLAGYSDFGTKDHEGFEPGYPMATFDSFLPGSTFKVVTSTTVYNLDPSLIGFNYPVQGCTAPGSIPTTTKQICNDGHTEATASPCGGTMVQMLPQSCDPGYATLGLKLGATNLYHQATNFGFNQVPPIDVTDVSKSNFPTPTELSQGHSPGPSSVAYAAFGQETVTATALQNAMVAEGIANTGVVMAPHVMAAIHDSSSGAVVQRFKPTPYKTASTASAAQSVKKLMQGVVTTPHGTAAGVGFTPKDEVAVKTGTAQVGNAAQNTVDWMIGLAPASNPTVAIAVVVPEQATTFTGAKIAGPIVKAMIEATLAEQARHPVPSAQPTTTTTTTPHYVPHHTYVPTTTPTPTTAPVTVTATTTTTVPATSSTTTVPVTAGARTTTPPQPGPGTGATAPAGAGTAATQQAKTFTRRTRK